MYEDKTLVCKECGKEFVFTAGEQLRLQGLLPILLLAGNRTDWCLRCV